MGHACSVRSRLGDGGWNDGTPGAYIDVVSTAWCTTVVTSAAHFGHALPVEVDELARWFDRADSEGTAELAAELLARFHLGQDPRTTPSMVAAADALVEHGDASDPETGYWASYALFHYGGGHWRGWR